MSFKNNILDVKSSFLGVKNVFFCGIGGIGMSGLALLAKNNGFNVSGSDSCSAEMNKNIKFLLENGINVCNNHSSENLKDVQLVVYTSAINLESNSEIIEAKRRSIEFVSRADFLARLMFKYNNFVVSGSHGKTTTTAMIGHILHKLNYDNNIILGGVMNEFKSNVKIGAGDDFAVESDESDGSFVKLPVDIGVINNIDPEHLDYYGDFDSLQEHFYHFAVNALDGSGLVVCVDNVNCQNLLQKLNSNIVFTGELVTCGFNKEADFVAENVRFQNDGMLFDFVDNISSNTYNDVYLPMFGELNVINAVAAVAAVYIGKRCDLSIILNSLSSFMGVEKRFSVVGHFNGAMVVDDYAHNPQKIAVAINAARHYLDSCDLSGRLIVFFEPHRYTRVKNSISGFVQSLKMADVVYIMDIYSSSEQKIDGIDCNFILNSFVDDGCKNVSCCVSDFTEVQKSLFAINVDKNDVVLFVGAGLSSYIAKMTCFSK
ncbi:MAG: hypothetical protein RL208_314 [Pseudomonadota bacterium]|jgi:UDP-N-acetylmuramate--alanine ligase